MVQWVSGETPYTCAACWAMSGKVFETGKQPHDHPNGRCVFNPYIPELAELDPDLYKHDPEENFAKLSEEEQKAVLGPKRFEMWKNGELTLTDLADTTDSDDYGESIKIRSLGDLAGGSGGGSGSGGSSSDGGSGSGGGPKNLTKTPAEEYNIDKQFTEQFNSMTPEMQELFAPYLKEGTVSGFFDDSNVDDNVKMAAGYKSPIDLALQMQKYATEQFPSKSPAELAAEMADKLCVIDIDDFGFEETPPLYCVADVIKTLDNKQGESSSRELLREWEEDSWSTYSAEIKKGMELIWGGVFYDNRKDFVKNEPLDPLVITYKMCVLKSIYDDSRKSPSGFKAGEFIELHRGYAGDNIGLSNSASSWSDTYNMAREIAEDAAIIRANDIAYDFIDNSPLKGKARDKKLYEIVNEESKNWGVESRNINSDCVLTGFGILPRDNGFNMAGQREFLVIGGLL